MTVACPVPAFDAGFAPDEESLLWEKWRASGCMAARDALIARHMELARILAAKMYKGRYTSEIEFGDYLQFAVVGLVEAIEGYDPRRPSGFRAYAAKRINGAILDGVGDMTERQQQIGLRQRLLAQRVESLGIAGMPGPTDATDRVFEDLARVAVGLALGFMLEGSAMVETDEAPPAEQRYSSLEFRQMQRQLIGLIGDLPEQERLVVKYHYLNQLPFEAVARLMALSKGRISQIHQRALERLRDAACRIRPGDLAW